MSRYVLKPTGLLLMGFVFIASNGYNAVTIYSRYSICIHLTPNSWQTLMSLSWNSMISASQVQLLSQLKKQLIWDIIKQINSTVGITELEI